jgi:chromosome segregation ATPase
MSDLYVPKAQYESTVAELRSAIDEARRAHEARWIIWGDKVEALEQQLRAANGREKDLLHFESVIGKNLLEHSDALNAANETISRLRAEIEDDNTAVRQVARECRLDDERTIARQAVAISTLKKSLEHCGGYLMTALPVNQPEWMEGIPEIISEAEAAIASIPKAPTPK